MRWMPLSPGTRFLGDIGRFRTLGDPKNGTFAVRGQNPLIGIDMDGTNDRIDIPFRSFDPSSSATGVTCSAWLYFDAVNQTNPQYLICSQISGDTNVAMLFFLLGNATAVASVALSFQRATAQTARWMTANTIPISTWIHVAATWSGGTTAATIVLYMNGRQVSMDAGGDGSGTAIAAVGTTVLGGRTFDDTRNLNGMMLDARIYDRPLTAAEVYALWDPATRWDLYALPRSSMFSIPAAANTPIFGHINNPVSF
jgi:hypothetical protein